MSRYVWAIAFAGVPLLLAGCGASPHHPAAYSSTAGDGSSATSTSGPRSESSSVSTTSQAGESGGVVFKASGPATAQALDVDLDNQTYEAYQDHLLPWSTTVPANSTAYALRVQAASPTPPVSCEIDVPGKPPVKLTAGAGQTVVFCQASPA